MTFFESETMELQFKISMTSYGRAANVTSETENAFREKNRD